MAWKWRISASLSSPKSPLFTAIANCKILSMAELKEDVQLQKKLEKINVVFTEREFYAT
jgi:hypothetical protein